MHDPGRRIWRRFLITFLATTFLGVVAVAGFIIFVDPYDTGRFGARLHVGIVDEDPRTADVSRGRDQRFNSAVIGNSHGQLLDPAKLSAGGGQKFTQLTVPGTGPQEQLSLLRWFLYHHADVGAVVLAADETWCSQSGSQPIGNPFPFWLYSLSDLNYAAHMLRTQALGRGLRRILLAAGMRKASDPAGYWDYEIGRTWAFAPRVPDDLEPAALAPRQPQRPFPSIERLNLVLSESASEFPLIIVFPPVFVTQIPRQGSAEAAMLAECKGAMARLAERRGAFIDFLLDGSVARDPANFMDETHYRANIARAMEARIVSALTRLAGGESELPDKRESND